MNYEQKIKHYKNSFLARDFIAEEDCLYFHNRILSLENEILAKGSPNYPQVDPSTITARHSYYNLLDYLSGEETERLKSKILLNSGKILGGTKFLIKMWANIFRNGQCIQRHMHHATPVIENDTFKANVFKTMCGNLFISGDAESATHYYFGVSEQIVKNLAGDIAFFGCIVEHETKPYTGDLRVGLAFDIYTEHFFQGVGYDNPPDTRLLG